MIYCKTCIMPNTRPDTEFVDGECSACISYRKRPEIDWEDRKNQLAQRFWEARAVRSQTPLWDCIVPSSGGKDSHYQVLTLKSLGYRPLVVTAETCHLTDIGERNITNLARHADTIVVKHRVDVRRKLNRIGLEQVGDISWPEHVAIFTVPFRMAVELRIPLIFYGENPQNQYGGPMNAADAMEMTARWRSEFGGFLGMRATDMIGEKGITREDMMYYEMPTAQEMANVGVQAHFLGQYIPWDSRTNASVAMDAGMTVPTFGPYEGAWWEFENLDNAQTAVHDHIMWRKYGYTRAQAQLSVDVRTGRIGRDEAIDVYNDLARELPPSYCGEGLGLVLDELGLSLRDYHSIAGAFTNWDIMKVFDGDWQSEPTLIEGPR